MTQITKTESENSQQHWSRDAVAELFALPLMDLVFQAQTVHRTHHDPNHVQLSSLLSIKTGACPEDCAYCPQSARYKTGLKTERLMPVDQIIEAAKKAKSNGAGRFCMGAAWRSPKDGDIAAVAEAVSAVKELGLETCATLGMLTEEHAEKLNEAGLDYYNHNLDTSPEYYGEIISTRTYDDRLETLENVRQAGMKVCCGGIVGMGESQNDRGEEMNDEMQALCFMAGANSLFYGDQLLTTGNATVNHDRELFRRLGINSTSIEVSDESSGSCQPKQDEGSCGCHHG